MGIPNHKNFEPKRTYEPQLWPSADKCTLHVIQILRHFYVYVCLRYFVKDGFHSFKFPAFTAITQYKCVSVMISTGNSRPRRYFISRKWRHYILMSWLDVVLDDDVLIKSSPVRQTVWRIKKKLMVKKFTLMRRNDLQLMVHVVQLVKTSIFTGLCKQGCRTGILTSLHN